MANELVITGSQSLIPVQVAAAGEQAAIRFIEFFTANIRNPNTRAAYARAVSDFFRWCEARGKRASPAKCGASCACRGVCRGTREESGCPERQTVSRGGQDGF